MQLEKACLQQQRPSTTQKKKKTPSLKIYRTFIHSLETLYSYVHIKEQWQASQIDDTYDGAWRWSDGDFKINENGHRVESEGPQFKTHPCYFLAVRP